jgi:NAD(P)-dependent dehydrogenase (short-subunit alcohol dehydrogenase family)
MILEAVMAIALITGTSSGIGLATAVTLARGGHKVIATMRNLDTAGEIKKVIEAERLPVTVGMLNVDDDGSVNDAVATAFSENGPIDVLVNNAGVPGGARPVEGVPMGDFRQIMETNFFGALRCIKAVIPSMREHRRGCIVNVSSVAGRVALPAGHPTPLPNGLLKL